MNARLTIREGARAAPPKRTPPPSKQHPPPKREHPAVMAELRRIEREALEGQRRALEMKHIHEVAQRIFPVTPAPETDDPFAPLPEGEILTETGDKRSEHGACSPELTTTTPPNPGAQEETTMEATLKQINENLTNNTAALNGMTQLVTNLSHGLREDVEVVKKKVEEIAAAAESMKPSTMDNVFKWGGRVLTVATFGLALYGVRRSGGKASSEQETAAHSNNVTPIRATAR